MNAVTKSRSWPKPTASNTSGKNLSLFSMYLGANSVPSFRRPTSLARSMILRCPSASMKPASPVRHQPSPVLVSAVASGLRKYSTNMPGLRNWTSLPSILSSTPVAGRPTVSERTSPLGWMVMNTLASVMP